MKYHAKMSYFYIIMLFLTIVTACNTKRSDYMFTLPDGTWICDDFAGDGYNCEHVMSGRKSDIIFLGENITVIEVKEGTK